MKKLSFLFVALALVGFITLSSCKSTTQPVEDATEVVEEAAEELVEGAEAIADSAAAAVEEVVE